MKHARRSLPLVIALAAAGLPATAACRSVPAASAKHDPKFPIADARAKALAQVPGGTLVAEELEFEAKRWIYSFEIKPKGETGKRIKEVNIDADTGELVSVDTEED